MSIKEILNELDKLIGGSPEFSGDDLLKIAENLNGISAVDLEISTRNKIKQTLEKVLRHKNFKIGEFTKLIRYLRKSKIKEIGSITIKEIFNIAFQKYSGSVSNLNSKEFIDMCKFLIVPVPIWLFGHDEERDNSYAITSEMLINIINLMKKRCAILSKCQDIRIKLEFVDDSFYSYSYIHSQIVKHPSYDKEAFKNVENQLEEAIKFGRDILQEFEKKVCSGELSLDDVNWAIQCIKNHKEDVWKLILESDSYANTFFYTIFEKFRKEYARPSNDGISNENLPISQRGYYIKMFAGILHCKAANKEALNFAIDFFEKIIENKYLTNGDIKEVFGELPQSILNPNLNQELYIRLIDVLRSLCFPTPHNYLSFGLIETEMSNIINYRDLKGKVLSMPNREYECFSVSLPFDYETSNSDKSFTLINCIHSVINGDIEEEVIVEYVKDCLGDKFLETYYRLKPFTEQLLLKKNTNGVTK